MADAGGGVIINLGSWIARLGIPARSTVPPSALETLTRASAAEFRPAGVRVNAISPGIIIGTHGPDGSGEHTAEIMMRGTPAGRSDTPEAIAHAAVYLASDEGQFCSRQRDRRRRRSDHRGHHRILTAIPKTK